ncbi:MAG: DUF805 domain-containing protein [Flavobacteriaceae bacterium]|nr:MAG: DUF805 domain-containing protein [Flavobacteriaceae bacterium]QMU64240.1 MAG: DUF805 domain-containing protein [Flavobacteriaceae bacterium]
MSKKGNIYQYKLPKSTNEEVGFLSIKGRITLRAFLLRSLLIFLLIFFSNYVFFSYSFPTYESYVSSIAEKSDVYWSEVEYLFALQNDLPPNDFYLQYRIFAIANFIVLPLIAIIFLLIQSIKRIHDTNKTGWLILIPLYNLFLLLSKGTISTNKFGIDPRPVKNVKYFDELKEKK